jgi:hypothetical protein
LRAVKALDFLATLTHLPDGLVEIPAQITDFILLVGELDSHVHVAITELGYFLLHFNQGPTDEDGPYNQNHRAYGHRDDRCHHDDNLRSLGVQREGYPHHGDQAGQQYSRHGQQELQA